MTLKNLQQEAHKIRMTPAEKAAMRASIFGAPSPLVPSRNEGYFFFDFQFMTRALAAVLLVVLVGGSGIAYAAQVALPGDALYPVKIHVTEPIEVALATTPEQKVQVETHIAERRVAEAQTLAAAGRLDATTTAEIEKNFDEHAARAIALSGEETPTIASTTSTDTQVPPQEDRKPRATALKVAAVTPEASSSQSEAEAASSTQRTTSGERHQGEEGIRASLETQKNILRELRLRVDQQDAHQEDARGHGGSDSNEQSGN